MTDATPLASEQITQEEAIAALRDLLVIAGTPITERQEAVIKRARAVVAAGVAPARGTLIPVTDDKGFVTLHEPDEDGKPGDLVASVWRDDWLATLSATPAPSDQDVWDLRAKIDQITHDALPLAGVAMDVQGRARVQVYIADAVAKLVRDQDASQAQGEVDYRLKLATALFEAWYGMRLMAWSDETRDYWLAQADAALSPTPGATAQDGVEHDYPTYVPLDPPTPTIPAGMVADEEFATLEPWEHDDQRELSLLYNHRADDSLQFNRGQMREAIRHGRRLAAAPKQAEQQGVEALAEIIIADLRRQEPISGSTMQYDDECGVVDYEGCFRPVEIARRILAALNAPTGAVEKGEAK